ncbi:MAG: hypothetical protein ACYDG2_02140 [Ruminiclostridium sp.]
MQICYEDSPAERIRGVSSLVKDGQLILHWKWTDKITCVYIYKTNQNEEILLENITPQNAKLYTKDEYVNLQGYHEEIKAIDMFNYIICPCVFRDGEPSLVDQKDKENRITVTTGKTNIFYTITFKKRLFSKRKIVQMVIRTEVPVNKEVLCYVKKEGGYPLNKEDGKIYPFVEELSPGRNILSEIEINEKDNIKIFFTDVNRYSEIFNLIRE